LIFRRKFGVLVAVDLLAIQGYSARFETSTNGSIMLKHDCKECGKRLSETAATCPNCGAPKPLEGWRQVKASSRALAIAALVFVFLVAGYGLFGTHRPATDNSAPPTAAVSVVKSDAATETGHADSKLPAPELVIKPGMQINLRLR
jgi:hypothetical protein